MQLHPSHFDRGALSDKTPLHVSILLSATLILVLELCLELMRTAL